MKKGIVLFIIGGITLVLSVILAAVCTSSLFLPVPLEILFALIPALLLFIVSITFFILGIILPKNKAKNAVQAALRNADAYASATYSYDAAYEALNARAVAWKNTVWSDDNKRLDALKALVALTKGVQDLCKMSSWFALSLDGPLYESARDALNRIDADKLKMLSGFISYCSSATEYELLGKYFTKACDNALTEVNSALELYASMRTKLSSFSGNDADRDKLRQELDQISLF